MAPWNWRLIIGLLVVSGLAASGLEAQVLSLEEARTRAFAVSPDLLAARAAVAAATAREGQTGAFPNPVLSYSREQTSASGVTAWQNIALLEQRLDFGGPRGARREAARLHRDAALARIALLESQLGFEVTRAYANAVAAERRARVASEAAEAFSRARRITEQRLAQGDVSGYTNRRIGLEAARYATLSAEAQLVRSNARLTLGELLAANSDSVNALAIPLADSLPRLLAQPPLDSLRSLALQSRPELRVAQADIAASEAEARAAAREAFPGPVAGLGFKNDRAATGVPTSRGFVLQVALPVPLWDRRRGAAAAFRADAAERSAESIGLRRRIVREVETAWRSLRAVAEQLEAIRPQLGAESRAALRAAEAAYAEGEISLVEWLDAVRAYQEAEASFATLQAEYVIQHAALERAVAARLN